MQRVTYYLVIEISLISNIFDINVHTIYLVPSILAAKSLFHYQSTSFFHHLIFWRALHTNIFFIFLRTYSYFFVYLSLLKI